MTTVAESIATVLVTRLEAITEANGYEFDVSQVVRVDRHGVQPSYKHLSIVIDQTKTRNEELSYPGNPPAIAWDMTFSLHLICRDSGDPQAKAINDEAMQAAAVKAVTLSQSDWYTLGGYAVNAEFASPEPYAQTDGEITGSTLPLVVTYRTSEYDLTVQR